MTTWSTPSNRFGTSTGRDTSCSNTQVQIYGEIGIVDYLARYDYRDAEGTAGSLPLRAVDIYRNAIQLGGSTYQLVDHPDPSRAAPGARGRARTRSKGGSDGSRETLSIMFTWDWLLVGLLL